MMEQFQVLLGWEWAVEFRTTAEKEAGTLGSETEYEAR